MHRHAFPLCIGHLAPFQCHRCIYISKGGGQEGSLCAPFPQSRNDLIYLFVNGNICLGRGHPATLVPGLGVAAEGEKKRDLWRFSVIPDPTASPPPAAPAAPPSQCLIHVMRVTFSPVHMLGAGVEVAQRKAKAPVCF